MPAKNKAIPAALYKKAVELMNKSSLASRKVLEENKRLKIPSPFSVGGRIYYLMPDGKIVLKR
jgi:hypothetical protein